MSARASREAVFAALFAKLQTVPNLKTVSRTMRQINEMRPDEFDAAFQVQGPQKAIFRGNLPTRTVMRATWALYTFIQDPTVNPSTPLNNLVDACAAALAPTPGQDKNTLGGLVESAAIDGEIEIYEGLLGAQAVALIPIEIVLPGF